MQNKKFNTSRQIITTKKASIKNISQKVSKRKRKLEVKVTNIFKKNLTSKEKVIVNVGGARSGKSYAIAQMLILKANNIQGISIAVTRKTMPALKMTAYRLFINLLKEYGLYNAKKHNRTEHFYELGKSRIQFFSLDDPEKIKSSEFNYIWMEEASEFTYQDYITLLTRISAPMPKCAPDGDRNQLFLTLNPNDKDGWIPEKVLPQMGIKLIQSSYKDNPFLSDDYVDTLLNLKNVDENYYRIFALGKWGQKNNLVYTNWDFVEHFPKNHDEIIWGLDFGFNNPSALVKVAIKDSIITAQEKIYLTGLTNTDLIKKLEGIIPLASRHQIIYADSAEPDRIKEISDAGFNVKSANKNVKMGIMSLKGRRFFVCKDSPNLIKEIQNYSWKTDNAGNILDETVKFNDHILDALRYATYTHFNSTGANPSVMFL
ncbi:MAG: PBSX family phage terminase large subunit [Elusimicrobiaceae bacterium]|jgi:phage terminase large subunit|nr:PBSX family phage terminase large subunit [Elusimicrobiaceae bacterium]MBT3954554.1 PBSX family phage terminase large subunit [Elusimicrobiaceae bacterium]MBT4008760.1 PBSX family phage terminase large subunit [Elusimicrobiaceae bacterium]MBT4402284.1 PBSX family phage terminase large subunit [Elusimicrobiaceae bacterium]MBT4440092.1 PBSX family phage terminase large subunit [Elusimicrobiaceae bacterium]